MSYDIVFFKLKEGEVPSEVFDRWARQQESGELNPGPIDPHAEAEKARIALALRSVDPNLEPFMFDYERLAEIDHVSEEEARRKYRHIELNNEEEAIQVQLSDNAATVTVPYFRKGEEAREMFHRIFRLTSAIALEGKYVAYDPQTDRVFGTREDMEAGLNSYLTNDENVVMQQIAKPWWKFW